MFTVPFASVRARLPHNRSMHEIVRLITFEEFRTSHHDTLRRQREHLRDDSVAEKVLREGGASSGWIPWSNDALATQS